MPGITELAFDYFANATELTFTKVPYRDIVQAVNDLAEDRLQVYSVVLRDPAAAARSRPDQGAGAARPERAASLPDIPTGIEAGFPEPRDGRPVGLFGTKATPPELREKIGADIVAVSNDKEIEAKLAATAQIPSAAGAKSFASAIAAQRAQVAEIVRALGIKPRQ